jgi:hypothetical protein
MQAFFLAALIILAPAALGAEGFRFRTISDVNYLGYSDGTSVFTAGEVLLWYAGPHLVPSFRISLDDRDGYSRVLAQPGATWVFGDGCYGELVFGVSADGDGLLWQEGFLQLNRETASTIAAVRLAGSWHGEDRKLYLAPDVSFRKQFAAHYEAGLRYFLGWDSSPGWSHSLQMEQTVPFDDRCSVSVLATGVRRSSATGADGEWSWSGGMKFSLSVAGRWTVRYLILYHGQEGNRRGIENGLTLDFRL